MFEFSVRVCACNGFSFQTKGDQCAVCLPGHGVFPAGLFYPVPQDADIIGHHVIEGLELLLDSLQLHSFSLSLFGPVDTNQIQPPQQSTPVLTCPSDRDTHFSAMVLASRAFLRLFLSSIIFCSCCRSSRRVFSRLESDTGRNFTHKNTSEQTKKISHHISPSRKLRCHACLKHFLLNIRRHTCFH